MALPEGMNHVQDNRLPSLPIDYAITDRNNPDGMVVLMPSALASKRPDRNRIIYTRSKWHASWPNAQVMSMPDPAVRVDTRLDGAWFIHPEYDVIKTIADIVIEQATAAGIPTNRIVFYGSSLGGFGAIAAAAHVKGARAVSEIPQVNFEHWATPARRSVEKYITNMPLEEYKMIHPEQLSLPARLAFAENVPAFRLITNPTEMQLYDQLDFYGWARISPLPHSEGVLELFQTTARKRHAFLDRESIVPFINP